MSVFVCLSVCLSVRLFVMLCLSVCLSLSLSANPSLSCLFAGWLVACLTSQQHASVFQGRICSEKFTCSHSEIEVADQTFQLTLSQHTDTGSTSPSADHITPGAWQDSRWSANVEVTGMTPPRKMRTSQAGIEPWIFHSRGGRLNH